MNSVVRKPGRVKVYRALLAQPRVLIMDEPTSSLTQSDTEKLFGVIGRLRAQGVSIIYVSHFLEECRRTCDRYTCLLYTSRCV